jgi:hypothetical protein
MKSFYALMCVFGLMLPYGQFISWLGDHGLAVGLLLSQAFEQRIAAFAWFDVLISAVVLLVFMVIEARRIRLHRLWLPVLATLVVGVSLGLPLFLLLREMELEKRQQA